MIFSFRVSASFLLPEMTRHQSSAYAERRIMPRLASLPWPAGIAGQSARHNPGSARLFPPSTREERTWGGASREVA